MNREIKFKAWDRKRKEWKSPLNVYVNGCNERIWQFGFDFEPYGDIDLLQYTGLKDKNGVEIYEGDIVSCDQAQGLGFKVIGIVHFGIDYRESSGWADPRIYLDTRTFEKHGSEFCIFHKQPQIIGNTHDNPELLKEKQ